MDQEKTREQLLEELAEMRQQVTTLRESEERFRKVFVEGPLGILLVGTDGRDSAESRTLFQKVLLASCSIPGLLPPVPIDVEIDGKHYTELHVDGSVTACTFLQPAMLGIGPHGALPPEPNPTSVWVIVAGKLHQTAAPTTGGVLSIARESITTMLQAKTEGELTRLFMLARYAGANFQLAGIPQDYHVSGDCVSFDPQVMQGLFTVGYCGGKDGSAWHPVPPGLEKEETGIPRSDTRFATVPSSAVPTPWTPQRIRITLDGAAAPNAHGGR